MIKPTRITENRQNNLNATTSASRLFFGRSKSMLFCNGHFGPPASRAIRNAPANASPCGCSNTTDTTGLRFPARRR